MGGALTLPEVLENIHGPLFALALHAWTALAGTSEIAVRLPSALFGALTVPALALFARRWLSVPAGIAAAHLAAASPFLIWYGQEARGYALLVLATCLSALALLELARRPSARALAGYVAAAWVGLLANLSFALLAPLHLHAVLTGAGPARSRALRALGIAAALALLLSPWLPAAARIWDWGRLDPARAAPAAEAPLRGETTYHAAAIPYALYTFAVGYGFGPPPRELRAGAPLDAVRRHAVPIAIAGAVFGALAVAGLVALARAGRLAATVLWLAGPIALVSYAAFQNFKVFHPRYVAVASPAFLLVIAAGLVALRPRPRAVAIGAIAALWTVSLAHHYFDPRHGREDHRAAARWIAERAVEGERVVAVGAEEPVFHYYRGPLPVRRVWLGFAARPDRLEQEIGRAVEGARGTWFVVSRPEDLDPGGAFVAALERRYPGAERRRFEGVRVWHVVTSSDSAGPGARPPS